ncbi:MAG: HTH domain-containing protein [Gammaproteobacteria bacterium]|nr:HTH domain-containing protein [Gammaproteobacteria bacterium]
MANPCSAQDIFELNKSKEYFLTASCLLEQVTTDPNLNAQASMLWQILFNKAKFDKNLQIQVSCSYLAQMLGKSIRTIQRYIKTLATSNYIVITNNYLDNGSQVMNTIAVRFPSSKIHEAKQTKDREKPEATENPCTSSRPTRIDPYVEYSNTMPPTAAPQNNKSNTTPAQPQKTQNCNKAVMEGGDKTVIQNNIDLYNNKINNIVPMLEIEEKTASEKTVVFSSPDCNKTKKAIEANPNNCRHNQDINELKGKIEKQQEQVAVIKKLLTAAEEKSIKQFKQGILLSSKELESIGILKRDFEFGTNNLQGLQKQLEEKQSNHNSQRDIETKADFIAAEEGPRPVSSFTFNRLNKVLVGLGYQDVQKTRFINEIIFEARFGSLIKSNLTQTEMPIDRAINIALKLVREGRWSTPALFEKHITEKQQAH